MRPTTRRRMRDRATYKRMALWPALLVATATAWALLLVAKGGG
jgi:hypothetical protein